MKLAEQTVQPIPKGTAPLSRNEAGEILSEIPQWSMGERTIGREFRFRDFRQVTLSTHKIGGLSLNDFIVAAKIDRAADRQRIGQAA
ncbi:MAG: pterin-4-alpha-carbinolamine dehydratase [Nitrospirae bacterium]|nr:pterin-4-alpha-carbinolamine dehydratase [Nitrospirota bacterium]